MTEELRTRLALSLPADLLGRLRLRYLEPHRHYHSWAHVLACFDARDELAFAPSPAVDLALLFHDAVYDPLAADNEAQSADLLRHECTPLGLSATWIEEAVGAIAATRHGAGPTLGTTAQVVCDADLSILAATPEAFVRYERQVRAEFHQVDDAAWRAGRARVLRGFLSRPRIYETDRGHTLWEALARHNLETSLWALGE